MYFSHHHLWWLGRVVGMAGVSMIDKQVKAGEYIPPAFPSQALGGFGYTTGMTLRDYFAAKTMQGLVANNNTNPFEISEAAYVVADAMLKARNT